MKKVKNTIILILAISLLIISFFIDNQILFLFSNLENSFFDLIMDWITNFGSLFVVLFLIPTLFSFREKKFNYIFYLWMVFFSSAVVSFLLKFIVARPRPLIMSFIRPPGSLNFLLIIAKILFFLIIVLLYFFLNLLT